MPRNICIHRHSDYEMKVRREAEALQNAGFEVGIVCLQGNEDEPLQEVDIGMEDQVAFLGWVSTRDLLCELQKQISVL